MLCRVGSCGVAAVLDEPLQPAASSAALATAAVSAPSRNRTRLRVRRLAPGPSFIMNVLFNRRVAARAGVDAERGWTRSAGAGRTERGCGKNTAWCGTLRA